MEKKTIYLKMVKHGYNDLLLFRFSRDSHIEELLKSLKGVRWNPYFKAWSMSYSLASLKCLHSIFWNIADIDLKEVEAKLKEYRVKEKCNPGSAPEITPPEFLKSQINSNKVKHSTIKNRYVGDRDVTKGNTASPEIKSEIVKFEEYLRHKRYSESTIKSYLETVRHFLIHTAIPAGEITNKDLITYNSNLLKQGYSSSYQNQVASSLKLFFSRIFDKKFDTEKIERPRCEHKLPNVLSKEEIRQILAAPVNLKHRMMLSLIYACGLRRSELLNLKPSDIDSSRGLIIIRQGKGRKDRNAPLPVKILDNLRSYYRAYRPVTWLFEGQVKNRKYSPASLAKVLKTAALKAGIKKSVSLHWLRHSYATHLLEQGTDLRIIQELLGHRSSKTTEIYTHVSTRSIQQVKSPFDDMDL